MIATRSDMSLPYKVTKVAPCTCPRIVGNSAVKTSLRGGPRKRKIGDTDATTITPKQQALLVVAQGKALHSLLKADLETSKTDIGALTGAPTNKRQAQRAKAHMKTLVTDPSLLVDDWKAMAAWAEEVPHHNHCVHVHVHASTPNPHTHTHTHTFTRAVRCSQPRCNRESEVV